jgi:hypothetical protein
MIKFIKNERQKIEKIYNEYVERYSDDKPDAHRGYIQVPTSVAMEIFDAKTKIDEKGYHSWFSPRMPSRNGCVHWHVDLDGDKNSDTDILISTFDSSTQFAIPKNKLAEEYSINRSLFQCKIIDEDLGDLIKVGAFEVFTPELGDIYWVAPGVIHRSNPACIDRPRLCLRLFKPEGYED